MENILVAGANAIDLVGVSQNKLTDGDSNIGRITLTYGGVSRNVAETLHILGNQLTYLTPFGDDHFSMLAQSDLAHKGIPLFKIKKHQMPHALYLSLHDQDASLKAAINDFSLAENVTPKDLDPFQPMLKDFSALVLDTNFSESVLSWLIDMFRGKPIFVDGVSQAKVTRIQKHLNDITLLKVNHSELLSLSKDKALDEETIIQHCLQDGLNGIIVSHGKDPVTLAWENIIQHMPVESPKRFVSSNGAGDALFSGAIHSLLQGKPLPQAVIFGLKLASLTMEVASAINPKVAQYASEEERSVRV